MSSEEGVGPPPRRACSRAPAAARHARARARADPRPRADPRTAPRTAPSQQLTAHADSIHQYKQTLVETHD